MHNKVVYQTANLSMHLVFPFCDSIFAARDSAPAYTTAAPAKQGDVRAALDFLASEFPGVPLLLAGFSFGSWVGMHVGCEDPRVSHLIGLGIPVNNTDFSFLRHCNKPKLFVHGSNDEHGAVEKVKALIPRFPATIISLSSKESIISLPAKLDQLGRAINAWLTGEVLRLRH